MRPSDFERPCLTAACRVESGDDSRVGFGKLDDKRFSSSDCSSSFGSGEVELDPARRSRSSNRFFSFFPVVKESGS